MNYHELRFWFTYLGIVLFFAILGFLLFGPKAKHPKKVINAVVDLESCLRQPDPMFEEGHILSKQEKEEFCKERFRSSKNPNFAVDTTGSLTTTSSQSTLPVSKLKPKTGLVCEKENGCERNKKTGITLAPGGSMSIGFSLPAELFATTPSTITTTPTNEPLHLTSGKELRCQKPIDFSDRHLIFCDEGKTLAEETYKSFVEDNYDICYENAIRADEDSAHAEQRCKSYFVASWKKHLTLQDENLNDGEREARKKSIETKDMTCSKERNHSGWYECFTNGKHTGSESGIMELK